MVVSRSFSKESERFVYESLLGLLLLFVCSQIAIPLKPVPITLQTTAVLLLGLAWPRKSAVTAVSSYLLFGAAGMPVWANFSGSFAYLCGPTGGYFFGFLVAVYAMARLRETVFTQKSYSNLLLLSFIGQVCIYAFGLLWLNNFVGSFEALLQGGLIPFIIPGVVKAFIVAGALKSLSKA